MELLDRLSTRYVRVDFVPAIAGAVANKIAGWAATAGDSYGPGLEQPEVIQIAARWAGLRHRVVQPNSGRFAMYRNGKFEGVKKVESVGELIDFGLKKWGDPDLFPVPIFGDERLAVPGNPGKGLPADWGRKLALALDWCSERLAKAERAAAVPAGSHTEIPTAAPVVYAIIVGGLAVAAIGVVAAYRYLDPDVRIAAAEIDAAASAYASRLAELRLSGNLPPPSAIELANAEAVSTAARKQSGSGWAWASAIGGGIAALTLAAAGIRYALSK